MKKSWWKFRARYFLILMGYPGHINRQVVNDFADVYYEYEEPIDAVCMDAEYWKYKKPVNRTKIESFINYVVLKLGSMLPILCVCLTLTTVYFLVKRLFF